jgi:tetratricopeptide (TPR) repeat protein
MAQLGDVYFENGKLTEAKAVYKRANALDPQSEGPLKGLLALSILEGHVRNSRQMMTGRLAHIDLARFCNLRGIALTANKRYALAERLYLNTADLLGDEKELYKIFFNLGLCMKKAGEYRKAEDYFQKCERSAPKAFSRASQQLRNLSARMR